MWVNLDDAEYICKRLDFPDCQIILRVDHEVRSPDGKILLAESRYFASSLDPSSVTSSRLQSYVRDHWQVENCLHFVKDRWWDEDRHWTRRPGLGAVFAALTNAAVSVLRLLPGSEPILRARTEQIQWNPTSALKLLGY